MSSVQYCKLSVRIRSDVQLLNELQNSGIMLTIKS